MEVKDYLQMTIDSMESARRAIQAGKRIATVDQLIFGLPFCRDDLTVDAQRWYREKCAGSKDGLSKLIEAFSQFPSLTVAEQAREEITELLEETHDFTRAEELHEIALRLDFYAAELGDRDAASRIVAASMEAAMRAHFNPIHRAEALISAAYFTEIARHDPVGANPWGDRDAKDRRAGRSRADKEVGLVCDTFRQAVEALDTWTLNHAIDDVVAESTKPTEEKKKSDDKATEAHAEEDDLSHIPRFQPRHLGLAEISARFRKPKEPARPGITVVRGLNHLQSKDSSLRGQFREIEERRLELAPVRTPGAIYGDLVDRYPWAESAIETIVKEVFRREFVRIRPTLFVGPPGSGKTQLAMELAEALCLKPVKYSCAGVADASFSGTSRQWSTSRASVPLQAVARAKIANPAIVLDEIEKTGTGSHNGSLTACLLDFLERNSAKSIFDPALECSVDLSGVVYFATANSLAGLPAALANRFRILPVPTPSPEHLKALVRSILDDHAAEEELDRRWIPDLDGDELEAIRAVWKGGSIRPLRAAIEATLQAREEFAPRM